MGGINSNHVLAQLISLVRNEDEELGVMIAGSVVECCPEDSADEISVALVRATASAMSRCLIGDQEAVVLSFLQVFDGNSVLFQF